MHIQGVHLHPAHGELLWVTPESTSERLVGAFNTIGELGINAYVKGQEPDDVITVLRKTIDTEYPEDVADRLLEEVLPENPRGIGRVAAAGFQVLLEKHPYSQLLVNPDYLYEVAVVGQRSSGHRRGIGSLLSYDWQGRRAR